MIELHPHQKAAIAATNEHRAKGNKAGLWAIPTGGGKTVTFARLSQMWGLPTLVMVHRDELVRQSVNTFDRVWPEATVGVVQAERDEWRGGLHGPPDVVIASVPSLHRKRLDQIPTDRFGLVINDEAHHASADTFAAVLEHFEPEFLLGCTATPERADGKDLSRFFGNKPIYAYPLRQAIEDGMLARITQYAIETSTSLDAVATRKGDFAKQQLATAVNTPERNRCIVEAFQKHAADRRAIAFCVDLEHVEGLRWAFKQAGVEADSVSGNLPIDERRDRLARFRAGEIRVMVSCGVLLEGFDDPGVDCGIMARPTRSRPLYIQAIGRCLRTHSGKTDALILDITDNCHRHDLVTVMDLMGSLHKKSADGQDVLETVDEEHRQAVADREIPSEEPISWRLASVCPWPDMPNLKGYQARLSWHHGDATPSQRKYLASFGVGLDRQLSKGEASYLIDRCRELRAAHPEPASSKQQWYLKRCGAWVPGLTKPEASKLIGQLKRREEPAAFA